MSWTTLVLIMLCAGCVCAALVPWARRTAIALGAIDLPDARRVHHVPTPRLGGLAVFASFLLVLTTVELAGINSPGANFTSMLAFIAGAVLVFVIGAVDDLRAQRPMIKLSVEIIAALLVVYVGDCEITAISYVQGTLELGAFGAPFTVLWIVLLTNALNLIDGIDGLAAGTAAVALLAIAATACGFELGTVAVLAAILTGCCLGFLLFNSHPASVFLGDAGSLFLGFSLGVLSTYARAKGTTGAVTIATLLLVALPLGDTLLAVLRRYVTGLSPTRLRSHIEGFARILRPDRNHLHHRLLRAGAGQRGAAYALIGLQIVACVFALYLVVRA